MGGLLPIVHVLGLMAMLMSATQLMPIVASVIYDDGTTYLFAFSMVLNFAIGFFVWLATRRYKRELKPRDGFLLVSLAWSGGAAFATVPLMLALPGTSFTDAYFETMSGLSTTGATVFSGLDDFPGSGEPLAPRAQLVGRHGDRRACSCDSAIARRWRYASLQG